LRLDFQNVFYFDIKMIVGISGHGKMGQAVERIAVARSHSVHILSKDLDPSECGGLDAIIEFTNAGAAPLVVRRGIEAGIPVISGTTGWSNEFDAIHTYCIERNGAMLWAPNFSVGMHIAFALNKALAKMMNTRTEYDVSIYEIHHTEKRDAPSGTAIALADQILHYLDRKTDWRLTDDTIPADSLILPIEALRIPDVKGDHRVVWKGPSDIISIRHEALSRDGFALGAVLAAEWIGGKSGVFTFDDVLRDILT
jgi:4-hydroxy-tetrahydrodipicolinate reductase